MRKITIEYSDNLAANGYSFEWRKNILRSALIGYQRVLKLVDEGKAERNRLGADNAQRRGVKGLVGKAKWFKFSAREEQVERDTKGDEIVPRKQKRSNDQKQPARVHFV